LAAVAGLGYSLVVTLLVAGRCSCRSSAARWRVPPVIVAALANRLALMVYAVLWVYQMLLYNGIMPRLTSEVIGLHPLLAFGALLVGGTLGGAWGALFSVPVAAVIAALARILRHRSEAQLESVEDA
jgi:predicted PurR-regulated permease PerM